MGIPDKILHKKGKLTDEEFDFIKKHISLGVKILEPIREFKDLIPYILYHHERYDGSGYPYGLSRDMIPLGAQIIGICDTFDALVTGRDYKKALSTEEAIQELERVKAKQFDPKLVDVFKEVILKLGQ
jgi:HD-GYP domain-containing protein (c-di-GMP phosphodiesterase class II)